MYADTSDPGMASYPLRVALAFYSIPSQSAIGQWRWGFHIVRSRVNPGDHLICLRVVGVADIWSDFLSGDGIISSPAGTGLFLDPQPVSDRPVGLRFPHRVGRFRPGGSPFLSPGCRSCRYRGIYDPGIGYYCPRVALFFFSIPRQSTIGKWGWGFRTVRGCYDPWDLRFSPRVVEVVEI